MCGCALIRIIGQTQHVVSAFFAFEQGGLWLPRCLLLMNPIRQWQGMYCQLTQTVMCVQCRSERIKILYTCTLPCVQCIVNCVHVYKCIVSVYACTKHRN